MIDQKTLLEKNQPEIIFEKLPRDCKIDCETVIEV